MTNSKPSIDAEIRPIDGEGHLACLTVNNPTRLNVVTSALTRQLIDAVRALYSDTDLRLVILTGAGDRAFVGGADVTELIDLDTVTATRYITALHLACSALRKMPVPVIARIDGYCLGAGVELAISCDLRIASDRSTFGMPEVHLGIPSVIEAAVLRRLVGPGKTRQLVLTGEPIGAEEAEACGLVERVVSPDALDSAVDEWTQAIVNAGPKAIRLQKELVRQWDDVPLAHGIQAGIRSFTNAYVGGEPRRLMQRFLDRKRR